MQYGVFGWACPVAIAGCLAAVPAVATGQPVAGVEHVELASDFSWGYRIGVKQPLGAYQAGFNVHQLSKSAWPRNAHGNPSYLLWVDEATGEHGIAEGMTDHAHLEAVNPGGQVAIDREGYLWLVSGARASDIPLDLYRSVSPYDPSAFELVLDDFVTYGSSTTPCITIDGEKALLYWRHSNSVHGHEVKARVRRYDLDGDFSTPELEHDVGGGVDHPVLGNVGIEQLWSRYDPRFGYHMYTWQWFDVRRHHFGSNPFVYSADSGQTWRMADGSALAGLPVDYTDAGPTLVPHDNLIERRTLDWFVRDLGVAPGGTFWITLPQGVLGDGLWRLHFWRFDGGEWSSQAVTGPMLDAKAHACGASEDALVLAYAEHEAPNRIWARVSTDDGETWSAPQLVHEVEETPQSGEVEVTWISFNQPAHEYEDDSARFFFTYSRAADGVTGRSYQNNVGWLKVDLAPPCAADMDGDGDADAADFFAFLDLFAAGDDAADLDGNGVVDSGDFFLYLDHFAAGC